LLRQLGMDSNGLQTVFMTNRPALERFLRARCGDPADSEDLLQELWLKLGGATGPVAEPLAYLYRMADNLVLDRRRSVQRRERRDDAWNNLASGGSAGVSETPSVERDLIARETLRIVEQSLKELGPRTAQIFKRFRVDGIGQRDIALEEGISLSAVEKHLQKAYRALLQVRDRIYAGSDPSERLARESRNNVSDE
jgi:RNA polymerase sigma factor (sigma-70 family)